MLSIATARDSIYVNTKSKADKRHLLINWSLDLRFIEPMSWLALLYVWNNSDKTYIAKRKFLVDLFAQLRIIWKYRSRLSVWIGREKIAANGIRDKSQPREKAKISEQQQQLNIEKKKSTVARANEFFMDYLNLEPFQARSIIDYTIKNRSFKKRAVFESVISILI